ncbi:hypothetical protein CU097_013754 [Rhizopus azygosporus]|uniref:Uncharacterized protein n=1 Tax=Rhizopus azygosporus TaxID=86630 RepID=A0A367JY53_RHIAZ|nr:hypothetical protein CU097_013754 [Rhizopus azygosporus]
MMSDNESGIKRATEQDEQLEALKKQKLDEPEEKKPVQTDGVVAVNNTDTLGQTQPNSSDDTAITSEQLLFALTSVPAETKVSPNPVIEKTPEEKLSETTTAKTTSNEQKTPPMISVTEADKNASSVTTSKETHDENKPAEPLRPSTSFSPSLSHATSLALNNLPNISAALRRLSNAGVIEQLSSSSSRSTHTGQERKKSIEVTPSEILGNALAVVAASARAANNNSTQTSSIYNNNNSSGGNSNSNNNSNTAAAIGNLAAITANISNFLNSSGFHRGSFSQEDTQKLAAAVASVTNNNNNSNSSSHNTARRNSSIAAVGNAFSNMIDQAMMIRRNKSMSAGTLVQQEPLPKPKLIVKNDQVWKALEGMEEKLLGCQVYSPHRLLPNLENCLNGIMEVRVPARYLTFENVQVKKRAIWGTDIYTDDSDIVAMVIHSGKYEPQYKEPEIEPNDPFALAIAGKPREATEAAKKLALSGKKWIRQDALIPDHDLKVTVRVLPRLQSYTGSIRHRIKSRDWKKHDGMSLYVNKVEKIKKGDARLKGRAAIKSRMFAYEPYRKKALGLDVMNKEQEKKMPEERPLQRGRVKKTHRVMRMFQVNK